MAVERIRGRALQRIRARHFAAHPLCVMCEAKGIITLATELDHIIALTNGGTNDDDNLQGLCAPCHEIKTIADLGNRPRVTVGADGWPVVDAVQGKGPRWRRAG
jgi:5-methylcytosine-specific restriction protein A